MEYQPLQKLYFQNKENAAEIYQKRFNSETAFKYDFFIGENQAFVMFNKEVLDLVYRVLQGYRKLQETKIVPPLMEEYFKNACLIEELFSTNEIEGVRSTKKQLQEVYYNKGSAKRFAGICRKYELIAGGGDVKLETCQDIRNLYDDILLNDMEEENAPDGVYFRKERVGIWDVSRQKEIHTGVRGEKEIISNMEILLKILHDDNPNKLINIAVCHYFWGYIHPFYDGNGRMARLISSYQLGKEFDAQVALNLSNSVKANKKKYEKSFEITGDFRNFGDLTPFVISFLEIVESNIVGTYEKIVEKGEKFEFYKAKIADAGYDEKRAGLLIILTQIALFGAQGATVKELAVMAQCSESTLRKYLKEIPKELLWVTGRGNSDLYEIHLTNLEKA
ncbi:MAG: Fic family protein [Clostridiales bacterium]|jgi:Fic family protein|nr:Fic family protein [Clostridiales bacterium]